MGTPAPQQIWGTLSQAERDDAYNNTKAVANSADIAAARDAASAAFRARLPQHLDVAYGPAPRQKLDLFPAADAGAPCLVFIHGGYWQRNARELFATYAEGLAAAGWSVALPGYTLAPEARLTDIVAEIGAALDWLKGSGPAHGIAGPLVISGWSAGGHLAAFHLGHPAVAAGLAISGIYELGPLRDTYLNTALRLTDEEIATLSPLRLPVVNKPLAIAYGTREVPALIHDARTFHALRAGAHAPGPLVPVAGADHFTILASLSQPDGLLARAARSILADAL
ncbi:esterase [Azorhizobium caulinodans ORS 571]|uniref:Esterase n=1 Tax=Azorhizobium caulinodans (strain ATCC 43989 / DSM 5975 / JCM 20966 / LMG 6465 / NBRC 14845 / NCIMB 13405 / ORS 571) TaxID=438753 RepID=A8INK6_AZOC5|nr:alpha/beta hydrolase [Azorhizobium caulinodans]BAF89760.1 esterase [Azorhizobium caulinodans ORS 571]